MGDDWRKALDQRLEAERLRAWTEGKQKFDVKNKAAEEARRRIDVLKHEFLDALKRGIDSAAERMLADYKKANKCASCGHPSDAPVMVHATVYAFAAPGGEDKDSIRELYDEFDYIRWDCPADFKTCSRCGGLVHERCLHSSICESCAVRLIGGKSTPRRSYLRRQPAAPTPFMPRAYDKRQRRPLDGHDVEYSYVPFSLTKARGLVRWSEPEVERELRNWRRRFHLPRDLVRELWH